MAAVTEQDVRELGQITDTHCISIYLPTHRSGAEVRQNPIRLKNQVSAAREQLAARGLEGREAEQLLAPLAELVDDPALWRDQLEGLAALRSPQLMRTYRLAAEVPESVVVSERFHLKPLLPALVEDARFYLLALSMQQVRLYEGSRHAMRVIDDGRTLPAGLAAVVGHDHEQRSVQFHTRAPGQGPGGTRDAMFHGQGRSGDQAPEADERRRFLEAVDRGVLELLQDRTPPLVVAAVERTISAFRSVSKYPNVHPRGVIGNPDELGRDDLHARAWELVGPLVARRREQARERYRALRGSGRTSADVAQVVRAAMEGRVDTVFATAERELWGRVEDGATELATGPGTGVVDLADRAAVDTVVNAGTAHVVAESQIPEASPLAAILRHGP